MKTIINIIACIAFGAQLFVSMFNALNMKKPETEIELLHNYFVLTAYICSLLSVPIFFMLYNFDFRFAKLKFCGIVFLGIILLGGYVLWGQLFVLNDFILTSCVILLFDVYSLRKIFGYLVSKTWCLYSIFFKEV